jgi:hypothetical protein
MDRRTQQTSRQPNEFIRNIAQTYNYKYSLGTILEDLYVAVDVHRARRIADFYEALPVDDSGNPVVFNAYHQLGKEIEKQWDFAINLAGMMFEVWKRIGQPYPNSTEMCRDVRHYRHLYFYQGGDPHPLLGKSDPATGLSLSGTQKNPMDMLKCLHLTLPLTDFWPGRVTTSNQERTSDTEFPPNALSPISERYGLNA